jgi:hypothetical protein
MAVKGGGKLILGHVDCGQAWSGTCHSCHTDATRVRLDPSGSKMRSNPDLEQLLPEGLRQIGHSPREAGQCPRSA